jgi:hypothetical protein
MSVALVSLSLAVNCFVRVSRFVESEVGLGREVSFLQGRSG